MNNDIKGEKLTVSGRVAGMHRTQYIFTEHSVSTSLVWLKCISWVQAEKCITLENLIQEIVIQVMEVLKVWATQRLEKQETSITLSATGSLGDDVTRTQKPGPSSGGGLPGGDWEMAEP